MVVTLIIAAAFFVAFVAMGYFGVQEREAERQRAREAVREAPPAPPAGFCPLCAAPLRRTASRDQVVFELEHHIDAELQDIAQLMRSPPESFGRIYNA